jgi:hypothetical protein
MPREMFNKIVFGKIEISTSEPLSVCRETLESILKNIGYPDLPAMPEEEEDASEGLEDSEIEVDEAAEDEEGVKPFDEAAVEAALEKDDDDEDEKPAQSSPWLRGKK